MGRERRRTYKRTGRRAGRPADRPAGRPAASVLEATNFYQISVCQLLHSKLQDRNNPSQNTVERVRTREPQLSRLTGFLSIEPLSSGKQYTFDTARQHNPWGANFGVWYFFKHNENSGCGNISTMCFHPRIARRLRLPHCLGNRLPNLSEGVCYLITLV